MSDERSTLRNLFFEAIDDMGCRNWGSAERKLSFIHGRMPDRSSVTINLALVYLNMNRVSEARVLMDTLGTQVSPEHFKKFSVVSAQVYLAMNNPDEALQALEIATRVNPEDLELRSVRALAYEELGLFSEAMQNLASATSSSEEFSKVINHYLSLSIKSANFEEVQRCIDYIWSAGIKPAIKPFLAQLVIDDLEWQNNNAKKWSEENMTAICPNAISKKSTTRIRIGYFSADFRDHPVSHLISPVFELHNRNDFEIFAFALQPTDQSEVHLKIVESTDQFVDLSSESDEQAIQLIKDLCLDIAIDLGGWTHGQRRNIFAKRIATVQIAYLGFLGSTGSDDIDYLVADRSLIPERLRKFYRESIIYLPWYQCNPLLTHSQIQFLEERRSSPRPKKKFCFAQMNNSMKISSEIFFAWVEILKSTPDTQFKIHVRNTEVQNSLESRFLKANIDVKNRIEFVGHLGRDEYLNSLKDIDLLLDTYPYNGGTTSSDALRRGVPVVSRYGNSFASRMGQSLLATLGLEQLCAGSMAEYIKAGISLSQDTRLFDREQQLLVDRVLERDLFKPQRFVKYFELALKLTLQQTNGTRCKQDIHIQCQ
jgi:predicted O-linked N-acetylglucosamine transferase (SPINDLY family)